jgi:L-ribulose-5-phosphate 3-epimerase
MEWKSVSKEYYIMMNFILSAFGDEISSHLDEQIQVLLANDIHYLEFRGMEGRGIIDYPLPVVIAAKRKLTEAGIAVSAVGSPIGKIPITETFQPHLEQFSKTIDVAHALNTTYIRMFSFYMPEPKGSDSDPSRYRDEVLNRWRQFIEMANGSGLTLLHENEKGIYGDTADRCLDLLSSLNCPYVKATFDPANFVQCGEETYPRAFEMLRKHIAYLHIKDAHAFDGSVVPAGQGDGKLPEILQALAQTGFEGFLSIEPHLNASLPGGGPELFGVAASALKAILKSL